ncbi:MAG TPA: hypothetical protein VLR45_08430, partial [Desulfoprunum sp.]|nr:hypothetical protein [Desulfoprunum sp.]
MYICVDFDGTIVDHRYPEIGEPVPMAVTWLLRLQNCGARLILFTMRSDDPRFGNLLTEAVQYLETSGVKLFGVNCNPDQQTWTASPKAYGHVYVDDS